VANVFLTSLIGDAVCSAIQRSASAEEKAGSLTWETTDRTNTSSTVREERSGVPLRETCPRNQRQAHFSPPKMPIVLAGPVQSWIYLSKRLPISKGTKNSPQPAATLRLRGIKAPAKTKTACFKARAGYTFS
tara:strand:+ start:238 stop:633 length:396 start_codon:yes stop_codon:yes gene_type:complete